MNRCYAGSVRSEERLECIWTICLIITCLLHSFSERSEIFQKNKRENKERILTQSADLKCTVTFVEWFQLVSTIKGNMSKGTVQFENGTRQITAAY